MDLIFGRRFRDNALQGAKTFTHEKRAGNGFVCRYLFVVYLEDKSVVYVEADTSGTTMKKIR